MSEWTRYENGEPVGKVHIPDPIVRDHGTVLSVEIRPEAVDRSDFPHPLVVVDYDTNGNVVGASFMGPVRDRIREALVAEL